MKTAVLRARIAEGGNGATIPPVMPCLTRCLVSGLLIAALATAAGTTHASASTMRICSGYGCTYQTRLVLTEPTRRRLAAIMRSGHSSAKAERGAIGRAVQHFERLATTAIGVADKPKGEIGGGRVLGQMDCIDESTNTRSLLVFLERSGLLRHHKVEANASRGFFLDQRYPHSTAVIRESNGTRWAVDSWYEPAGGLPDIMPLERWRRRGVRGER